MNYRCFIWQLPWLLFCLVAHGAEPVLQEECRQEPVFNGRVCLYQANREADKSIVLVHGIGDNASRDWSQQIAVLAQEYHVVAVDLPGFGRSAKGDNAYSPQHYVRLLEFLATEYALGRFDLVGHSMGAAVTLLYAATYPERVRRLVLVDSAGILHRLAIGKYVIAGAMQGAAGETANAESYVVKIIEKFDWMFSLLRNDTAEQSEHLRAGIELVDYDFGPALATLQRPTLILWGEEDRIAPLRTARVLHYRIRHSQLQIIKGAGHMPMQEQSEVFNRYLLEFLRAENLEPPATPVPRRSEPGPLNSGQCDGKTGVVFRGDYARIEIRNCRDVAITGARVGELSVFESRVTIDDSDIGDDTAVALESVGSDIKVTASQIHGRIAIKTARSRLDMAAVDLFATQAAVETLSKSRMVCSVCRSRSAAGEVGIHESVTLLPGRSAW